nr:reverse transcriptase domain-containing protein [Tanacetum cinerariifolium]
AIISDRGTHFCNDQFTRVMIKYGVTHRQATSYHPQTSGQVEVNFNLKTAGDHRKLQLNELSELRDQAYENSVIYKERTKKLHDSKIKNRIFNEKTKRLHDSKIKDRVFNIGDRVLLFNSRLNVFSGKLKPRWSGPFTISQLQLNELSELRDQAYENSVIYKERTKKLHDSKIKNRIFNVGDQVLLFNTRLKIFSGKLKTRWSGPFTITQVFPYGTIKLSQPNGPNFKVNGHRVKHYFGGDIPSNVVPDLHTFPKDK